MPSNPMPGRRLLALLGGLSLCVLPSVASAQAAGESDAGAYRIVVSVTRTPQPIRSVVADTTLIDNTEIEESGAVNIVDLLQRQPGVEITRNGGPGTASSVFLRGAETRFTAVYIDGVRVDSQSTGGAPWEAIALSQVDRIEIVRGPAAAVYGSDAMAGVIQIFTKRGEGPASPYVGVGLGNHRTWRLETGVSGSTADVDYALGLSRDASRGFNIKPEDGNPDRDGYRQTAATGQLGWRLNEAHELRLNATYTDMDAEYDGFDPGLDDHGLNRLNTLGGSWSARWTDVYRTRLELSESDARYETRPSPYLSKTRLRNALFQNEWRLDRHTFTATLERRDDKLENEPIDRSRHQNALALGYQLQLDQHDVQLNLRHDRDSEFGGQTTGGIGYGWRFAPSWRLTAAYGTAFRVPTLYQRFSEYGSAELEPEKSRNLEFGLRWSRDGDALGVVVYRNRIRNLINFGAPGPCAGAFGCYENAGNARLTGMTLSGAKRIGRFDFDASLDLLQPRNLDTGKILARRARRQLKLGAQTDLAGWKLGGEWLLASHRYDDAANQVRLGGYGTLNLHASRTIAREWDLLMRVNNLADRNYQLAGGYATPGREFFVGLRWTPR